jgi:hypothetical protein
MVMNRLLFGDNLKWLREVGDTYSAFARIWSIEVGC